MSTAFELALPPRISFGAGTVADLPSIVAGHGSRVLVVTGATPGRVAPLIERLRAGAQALA
ncbi:MAG: hypothetical protein WCF36_09080, partial [Candidatus Nanopelagicales bacterium]